MDEIQGILNPIERARAEGVWEATSLANVHHAALINEANGVIAHLEGRVDEMRRQRNVGVFVGVLGAAAAFACYLKWGQC